HAIDVKIGGNSIPGCPFLVKVYDARMVKVTDINDGVVGQSLYFTSTLHLLAQWLSSHFSSFALVDASMAGAGNLEIIVSSNGRNVPNYVQSEGNARFKVNFKPTEVNLHVRLVCFFPTIALMLVLQNISCKFNGEPVPG